MRKEPHAMSFINCKASLLNVCVQAHKRHTTCTGKRPRTDPVPLARFDDNQLISGTPPSPLSSDQ